MKTNDHKLPTDEQPELSDGALEQLLKWAETDGDFTIQMLAEEVRRLQETIETTYYWLNCEKPPSRSDVLMAKSTLLKSFDGH